MIGEPTAVMFRRSAGIRGFAESYDQLVDLEMWCHLLCKGTLVYTSEALCSFRRHPLQRTEFNKERGIHHSEMMRLIGEYCHHPILRSQGVPGILFLRLYRTRKHASGDPELAAEREVIMRILGRNAYRMRWLWKKLSNPFAAIARRAARWKSREQI